MDHIYVLSEELDLLHVVAVLGHHRTLGGAQEAAEAHHRKHALATPEGLLWVEQGSGAQAEGFHRRYLVRLAPLLP